MALEENEARPRLLIVRGSFATMGGAERELLQLIRMAHGRWDVHLATLDISPEAVASVSYTHLTLPTITGV